MSNTTFLNSSTHFDWQIQALKYIESQECDVLLLSGGFGSGKTSVNAHNVLEIANRGNKKGIVIAPTYSSLKDTVLVTLEDEIPVKHCELALKSSPFRWNFPKCKSQLVSRSMRYHHEVFRQLKSINADFLWLVEATELPREAFTVGISRLRRSGENVQHPIVIETNPSSKSSWVYQLFLKDSIEIFRSKDKNWWVTKKVDNFTDDKGRDHVLTILAIHATTYANTEFPRATIHMMEQSYSPSEAQRLLYGIWNAKDSRVWEYYKLFEVKEDPKKYADKYDDLTIGVDPAQTHPTAIVLLGLSAGRWEAFDEYVEVNKSVRDCHKQLIKRLEHWGLSHRQLIVWVDPSAKQWVKEWNDIPDQKHMAYQSKHRGTDPALNRAVKLGEMLRTERLVFNNICKNAMNDCEQAVITEGERGKETVDKKEYDPHTMDAIGYALQKHY